MAKKFLTAIDLAKNELQNAQVQNLAAAPSTPVKGQLYMNTSDNTLYWWDGTVWQPAKSGAPAFGTILQEQTFGATKVDGVATTVARSDHGHGNPIHDNSAHSAITLNSLAVPTTAVSMNGQLLTNVGTPVSSTDASNKSYVDNLTAGLSWKEAARAALTTNRALTALTALDGVTPVANDRILLMGQTAQAENGLWLAQTGAWTRPTDYDAAGEAEGAAVFVLEGTANGDKAFVNTTNAPITIGTTSTVWVQFGGGAAITAGAGLTGTTTFDVVAGDTSLTVAADNLVVNTAVIATVASVATKANTSTTVTAGTGLTGGGDLSANRTFDVGAGTGITVAADTVALDTTYADGRYVGKTGAQSMTGPLTTTVASGTGIQATGGGDIVVSGGGSLTVLSPGNINVTGAGSQVTNSNAPTATNHLTNKAYVDGLVKRFAQDVGGSTAQVITHNLNTLDTVTQVYRKASPFDQIECDVEHTSTTTSTLRFTVAPAAAEYRVVVLA